MKDGTHPNREALRKVGEVCYLEIDCEECEGEEWCAEEIKDHNVGEH